MIQRTTILLFALLLTAGCKAKPDAETPQAAASGSGAAEVRPAGEPARAQKPDDNSPQSAAANLDDPQDKAPARDDEAVPVQSDDILAREPVSQKAEVQHVLISWSDLGDVYARRGGQDPRGAERTKLEADKLALSILQDAKGGENFTALMRKYSEDPGSAKNGQSYPVTPDASLVEPFKNLSLRLEAEETGVVESSFGYHIIYRVK